MKYAVCWLLLIALTACSGKPAKPESAPGPSRGSHPQAFQSGDSSGAAKEPAQWHVEAGRQSTAGTKPPERQVILDVGLIAQNPELKYGCEVTSLAMLLNYAGVAADKMELAAKLPKDPDPVIKNPSGDIRNGAILTTVLSAISPGNGWAMPCTPGRWSS